MVKKLKIALNINQMNGNQSLSDQKHSLNQPNESVRSMVTNSNISDDLPNSIKQNIYIDFSQNILDSNRQMESQRSNALNELDFIHNRSSRVGSIPFLGQASQSKINNPSNLHDNGLMLINGNIEDNKFQGTGRLNSEDYVYCGQWLDSKFHGYGRIAKRNFALYEGQFYKNRRNGYGIEIYVNSDIYIGEFKADRKNGLGIYLFATGGYYYGFFEKNLRDGFGTLYNRANRQTYTGFWKKDLRHGRGIEFYKNGSKYDGFFQNDKRHGVGFMEYSKSLLYIGEWNAGKRDGLGKVEHNKKTVSGRFKADQFVEPFFFNSSNHADILLRDNICKTVEEYLKQINYKLKKTSIIGIGDIYGVLKESLVSYVFTLVESSILRLNCYLKLKNIFSKSSRFEYVMDDILLTLKYEPNPNSLMVFWDPALREILINKQDFSWQKWSLDVAINKIVFDETQKGNESTDIQFIKNEDSLHLIVTNELAFAKTSSLEAEGVLSNEGFSLKYFKSQTAEWETTASVRIYPFFLFHEDFSSKSILSLKFNRFVGEFYFGKDTLYPRTLNMFLALNQENVWYSVGIDSVGSFVMAGRWNKTTSSGQLLQKYFLEYQIEYELFLATSDKLQGLWKTTNMGGHFVLRKDNSYKFTSEIAQVLYAVFEHEKNSVRIDLNNIPILKPLMESSILSVIVKGKQQGIPEFLDKKEEIEDMELFEKYKKLQEPDSTPTKDFFKKGTLESPLVKTIIEIDENRILDGTYRENYGENLCEEEQVVKKGRASLAFLNLKALDKVATNELHEIEGEQNQFMKNDFQTKLSNALRNLRQVFTDSIKFSQYKFDQDSENISWVGNFVTLGKEEQIIFDNLYIIGDIIEGIFTDLDNISYELAGSYSLRTKEFEIVGMSFDKTKSVKIRGVLSDFKLKGIMTKKPTSGPSSNVDIKLLGSQGKATIRFLNDKSIYEQLDFILKLTPSYIYGIMIFEKDYVFINGIKDKGSTYGIELNTNNKRIRNNILIQYTSKDDNNDRMTSFERKLIFKNEEMEITLHY